MIVSLFSSKTISIFLKSPVLTLFTVRLTKLLFIKSYTAYPSAP